LPERKIKIYKEAWINIAIVAAKISQSGTISTWVASLDCMTFADNIRLVMTATEPLYGSERLAQKSISKSISKFPQPSATTSDKL
jgi:adenosylcobinamide amidohydrolase